MGGPQSRAERGGEEKNSQPPPGIQNIQTIILPLVFYKCETWPLALGEEQRLRIFVSKVLKRIFGPSREEGEGGWRRLHNEELHAPFIKHY